VSQLRGQSGTYVLLEGKGSRGGKKKKAQRSQSPRRARGGGSEKELPQGKGGVSTLSLLLLLGGEKIPVGKAVRSLESDLCGEGDPLK